MYVRLLCVVNGVNLYIIYYPNQTKVWIMLEWDYNVIHENIYL